MNVCGASLTHLVSNSRNPTDHRPFKDEIVEKNRPLLMSKYGFCNGHGPIGLDSKDIKTTMTTIYTKEERDDGTSVSIGLLANLSYASKDEVGRWYIKYHDRPFRFDVQPCLPIWVNSSAPHICQDKIEGIQHEPLAFLPSIGLGKPETSRRHHSDRVRSCVDFHMRLICAWVDPQCAASSLAPLRPKIPVLPGSMQTWESNIPPSCPSFSSLRPTLAPIYRDTFVHPGPIRSGLIRIPILGHSACSVAQSSQNPPASDLSSLTNSCSSHSPVSLKASQSSILTSSLVYQAPQPSQYHFSNMYWHMMPLNLTGWLSGSLAG